MALRTATANNKSPVVQILTWFFFVVAIFSVCARLGTKYAMSRSFGWDDRIMLMAFAIYFGQCITISIETANGLGKHLDTLTDEQVMAFLKADYASLPLLVLASALVKWSISIFIKNLSPSSVHRRADLILRIVVGSWLVVAVITALFQCSIPTPWDFIEGKHCIHRGAWWTFIALLNIITDLCIVALHFVIIGSVQISASRKTAVLCIFSSRILVAVAAVAQLALFWRALSDPDITFSQWLPTVCNQIVLSLSFATACLSYLKPFMESLESSVIRVENVPGSEEELSGNRTGSSGYYLSALSSSMNSASKSRSGPSPNPRVSNDRDIRLTRSWAVDTQESTL
ncbi:hypothetical protein K469DRAFT_680035 [Zopfia rhizophila CBS 207.26]|uniref:Rhodopsin domain-containing protein n=1 Tax=Zopfia rhizophila CBS 207.26 TaxID=1314779 RepID=A0A6A6DCT6_9PEZI|nr:hypothetical protein K469DRAFT_680035 [Zopfia rhizophila CBS 207.26]